MENYRLPMDADGVKYHGVVDEDGQFPGQVLYGLDKNGRLKPINVDGEGNVLTRVTGSIVEDVAEFTVDSSEFGDVSSGRLYLNSDGTVEWLGSKYVYDISEYRKCVVLIKNNTDKDISRVSILYYLNKNRTVSASQSIDMVSMSVEIKQGESFIWYSQDDSGKFEYYGGFALFVRFKSQEQPSDGSITWEIAGVR